MSSPVWEIEHSVETAADPAFSWAYMSDVRNWDDPPAEFTLHGVFVSGVQGTTRMPGQSARQWQLRGVTPIESYTIKFPLDGASIFFKWQFNGLPGGRTRLTQHISVEGENASTYAADVKQAFAPSLAPGMNKIAAAIDRAYAGSWQIEKS